MTTQATLRRRLCSLLAVMACAGCGHSGAEKLPVAPVKGKVLCEGKPLAQASVLFNPVRQGKANTTGRQGYANTNEKGEFVLSTYTSNDGAVIGKHKVIVAGDPKVPCDCIASDTQELMEVEVVKDQENTFEIVLPKKTGRENLARRSSSDDD